jgi:sortase (surface protein transpeptidase)
MGGFLGVSMRGRLARVAIAGVAAGAIAALVVLAAARMPALRGTPLAALAPGGSQSASAALVAGGPRVGAATRPTVTADPGTRAAEKALTAPSPPPARLLIPALGVNALVEAVGITTDGSMAVPSQPDRVAWYQPGVAPGDPGDALIDGHLDWWTGPAVFWHLANLHPGDQVSVIRADSSQLTFTVDATRTYPWNAQTNGLVTDTGTPSISLVTCAGTWDRQRQTYLNRLVVHATLAASAPQQTPGDEGG